MKLLLFILLLFPFQNDKLLIEFVDANTSLLYDDLISITVLESEETKNGYYNSKTYFTTEGYILLPYDDRGTNLIIGACDNTLYYYVLPNVERTTFLLNTCSGNN